jgi:hypothetical protein
VRLIIVPFHQKEIVEKATLEERRAMFEEWKDAMRRANPRLYNADGTLKKWWQLLLFL